ncbi:glycosyltransferase family 2 protein [Lysinibacillus xylanilyticus]|uniref:glycosyltransferase family 2 protein n=1 Tax=Lysinibacillus xylanilyticus TaxID=582475 RepID=UPI003804F044
MKISALLSTYNNELVIKETIDSVLQQTYRDFEFIIVNDGSTDNTKEIIESYNDSRIKLINLEENIGIPKALNVGLEHCIGNYIIKVDGDDIQHPERFEKQLNFMEQNPNYTMSKCLIKYFANDDEVENTSRYKHRKNFDEKSKNRNKTPEEITESLMWHCSVSHTTMMIKSDVLKKYKYRNLEIFEDYDLFYRLIRDNLKIGHFDEELVQVRVSKNSTTGTTIGQTYLKVAYKIKNHVLNNFKKNPNIFIWGTGSYAEELTKFLENKDWDIKGYVDSYNFGDDNYFEGKKIYSSEILNNKKDIKIIIAASTGLYEIAACLKRIGYETNKDFIVLK